MQVKSIKSRTALVSASTLTEWTTVLIISCRPKLLELMWVLNLYSWNLLACCLILKIFLIGFCDVVCLLDTRRLLLVGMSGDIIWDYLVDVFRQSCHTASYIRHGHESNRVVVEVDLIEWKISILLRIYRVCYIEKDDKSSALAKPRVS